MKKILIAIISASLFMMLTSCASVNNDEKEEITIAAAASMEYSLSNEIIPMFKEEYGIDVVGTYDSSGKLQKQIENGLEADVFLSAAEKQMNELEDRGFIKADSRTDLLENKLVLITASKTNVSSFENINDASIIAIGDPSSVPAGQYAQTLLTNMGIWDQALTHASLGTNVTEVLGWVASGSAEVGIVYSTDAAQSDVRVIAEAPENIINEKIIYPVGVLERTDNNSAAQKFVEFLKSEKASAVFEKYGFTVLGDD